MKVLRLTAEFEAGDITPGDAITLFDAALFNAFPIKVQRSGIKAEIVELTGGSGRLL